MKNKILFILFLIAGIAWGQETTVTYSFSAGGAVTGLDANPPIALDANIGFSSHQNSAGTAPGIFSGQLRLYQNATKGGSIKIYAQNGVTITGVVVNASNNSGDGPAGYSVDNTTEAGSWSDGTTIYAMSNLSATDYVEFYNKGTTSSTRTYVDNFEVTYTMASSCEDSNLAFTDTTVNKDLLDPSFTQTATSLNATTAITYESSDELVATVNTTTGEVALVGIGTATITASQEAGEHSGVAYCAGTATYDVVVTSSAPILTVSTNSASFTGFAGGTTSTETITVEGFNLTGNIALALSGDTNFSINPTSLSSTGGEVTITYTPSATPAAHSATLTVSNGALSEVITLSGVTNEMPEEYAGVGTFEKITSTDDLTDGYYVIIEANTNANAMTNNHNGTFLAREAITPTGNTVENPHTGIVWYIETNGGGHTIYNEVTGKYVSYTGSNNNIQVVDAVATNNQRWTITYTDEEFHFNNVSLTTRKLQYNSNSGQERFAAYTDSQKNLLLYKLTLSSADPSLSVSESSITGLNYGENNGPSASQSFVLSGTNMDGTADAVLLIDDSFALSLDDTDFSDELTLANYNGAETTIYVRMVSGLALGAYSGSILIDGYGIEQEVTVSGNVLAVPIINDEEGLEAQVGVEYTYQIIATNDPTSYSISSEELPAGLALDEQTGIISGTPTEAGEFLFGVTATNTGGTSVEGAFIMDVTKGTQTIDGFADMTKYDTDAPFDLPETTNADLVVSYVSSNTDVATVVGNTITIAGLGTTTITATQAGDVNWNEFEQTITLTVTESPVVCGFEDFTNATELPTGSSYGGGTFTGNNDIVWNYHGQSAGDYEIDGNGFLLRRASDSYLEATIPDGVAEFSFDYRKAYTGNNSRQLELLINGVQVATSPTFGETPTGADATVYTFTHTVDVEGEVTVRIKLTGSATTNRHTTIDNITWTCYSATPSAVTWTGTEWINGTPSIDEDVVIAGDLFVGTDFTSFEAKSLTVVSGGAINIESGSSVTVAEAIDNQAGASNFIVESGANLVQINPDAINVGEITVERNSSEMIRQDGTYWSSPVAGQNVKAFSNGTLNNRFYIYNNYEYNPENSSRFKAIFVDDATYPMPSTIPTEWYEDPNEISGNLFNPANYTFKPGWGYSIRVPNNWSSTTPAPYLGEFVGVPHNGEITVPVYGEFTMVGNPYPSTISTTAFFTENTAVGTLHFWTHYYPVGDENYSNNYVTFTQLGGAGLHPDETTTINSEVIEVAQGFIVQDIAKENGSDEWAISFNNTMRSTDSGLFIKNADEVEKHRFWISLTDAAENKTAQILIGYMTGATQEYDRQIDGHRMGRTPLYSLINDEKFTVQGRALPFSEEDIVPLGFTASQEGSFTLSLDKFDGLFEDHVTVYVKDNATDTLHNLTEGDYMFESDEGEFPTRFEIVYKEDEIMNTQDLLANSVQIYRKGQDVVVESKTEKILSVELFDMNGRNLHRNTQVNAHIYQFRTLTSTQILVVKVLTQDGEIISKKILNK